MPVLWLAECPEPGCLAPAERLSIDTWDTPSGPVGLVRTRCLSGHILDRHVAAPPLSRDMPCPYCPCSGHRFTRCECGCPPHDLKDAIEP